MTLEACARLVERGDIEVVRLREPEPERDDGRTIVDGVSFNFAAAHQAGNAAAALATLATLSVLRLLVVFPEGVQRLLLTSHLDLYARQDGVLQGLVLLLIYTAAFGWLAVYAFERRDV